MPLESKAAQVVLPRLQLPHMEFTIWKDSYVSASFSNPDRMCQMTELHELVQQTWIWDSGQSASSLGFITALSVGGFHHSSF